MQARRLFRHLRSVPTEAVTDMDTFRRWLKVVEVPCRQRRNCCRVENHNDDHVSSRHW